MKEITYRCIGQSIPKKDAMQLLLGKPAYLDDVTPRGCLVVKLLRSPHAHAYVTSIDFGPSFAVCGRSGGDCGRCR